jgi:hypothetical protein
VLPAATSGPAAGQGPGRAAGERFESYPPLAPEPLVQVVGREGKVLAQLHKLVGRRDAVVVLRVVVRRLGVEAGELVRVDKHKRKLGREPEPRGVPRRRADVGREGREDGEGRGREEQGAGAGPQREGPQAGAAGGAVERDGAAGLRHCTDKGCVLLLATSAGAGTVQRLGWGLARGGAARGFGRQLVRECGRKARAPAVEGGPPSKGDQTTSR